VPVLRENNVLKSRRDAMDGRDHLVAQGNGKRAAGEKIVLHVDDEKNVVLIDFHRNSLSR
jgi:phage I-like protein